jgi:ubiquitin
MDEVPAISAAQLKAFLHEKVDDIAERIVSAVNAAAPGRLIADSEEPVRQAMAELTRAAYEAALQQKVNAAEAAFPPSARERKRKETA